MVFIVLLAVRKKPPGAAAKGVLAGHGWRWVKFLPPSKQAWPLFLIYGFFKSTLMLQKKVHAVPHVSKLGAQRAASSPRWSAQEPMTIVHITHQKNMLSPLWKDT